jgi:hypothetical protein
MTPQKMRRCRRHSPACLRSGHRPTPVLPLCLVTLHQAYDRPCRWRPARWVGPTPQALNARPRLHRARPRHPAPAATPAHLGPDCRFCPRARQRHQRLACPSIRRWNHPFHSDDQRCPSTRPCHALSRAIRGLLTLWCQSPVGPTHPCLQEAKHRCHRVLWQSQLLHHRWLGEVRRPSLAS